MEEFWKKKKRFERGKWKKLLKAGSRFVSTTLAHDAIRLSGMTNLRQKESIKRKISGGRWKHNIFRPFWTKNDGLWKGFPSSLFLFSIYPFSFFHLSIQIILSIGEKKSIELFSNGKCFSLLQNLRGTETRGERISFPFQRDFPPLCFYEKDLFVFYVTTKQFSSKPQKNFFKLCWDVDRYKTFRP